MRRTMMKMIGKGIKRKNENPPVRKKTRKMNGNVWNVKQNVIHWKRYLNTYTKMSAEDGYVVRNTGESRKRMKKGTLKRMNA